MGLCVGLTLLNSHNQRRAMCVVGGVLLMLMLPSACSAPATPTADYLPTVTPALVVAQASPTPVPTISEEQPVAFISTPVPVVVVPTTMPTEPGPTPVPTEPPRREFDAFVARVKNGRGDQITGVYVQGILALPVIQQPTNANGQLVNPAFVSENDNEATQFLYAYIYANGNIGLLAHNYLAGRYFFDLRPGDVVELIYGDGAVAEYEIDSVHQYQALSPRSPTSNFLDLVTGETLTSTDLFYRVYGGDRRVTFQTCINRDNDSEWGRLFPIAFPSD